MAETPTTEKVINTYRQVTIYYVGLEELAAKYQTEDRSRCALAAVGLTMRFLKRLKVSRRLMMPLYEAARVIERDIGANTLAKQRQEMNLFDSAVVSLQMEEGAKLEDALKKVVGQRDPEAAKKLGVFRNNMKKSHSKRAKEARDIYHLLKRQLKEQYPTETARRALGASHIIRGKKG